MSEDVLGWANRMADEIEAIPVKERDYVDEAEFRKRVMRGRSSWPDDLLRSRLRLQRHAV